MAYKKSLSTKQKIIDATQSVIIKKGYENMSIKDIVEEIDIPRTLVYYYYPNKESILNEISNIIYQKTLKVSDEYADPSIKPITNLLLKYILLFRYIVLNDVTKDYFLAYGPYVSRGLEKIELARQECYPHIESIFEHYNISVTQNVLYEYIITSDSLIKALFQGVLNGCLDMSLNEVLLYFGRHIVLPSFHLSKEEYEQNVVEALLISETIEIDTSCILE